MESQYFCWYAHIVLLNSSYLVASSFQLTLSATPSVAHAQKGIMHTLKFPFSPITIHIFLIIKLLTLKIGQQ